MKRIDRVRRARVAALLLLDVLLVNAAVLGALLTRFEFDLSAVAESGFVEQYFRIAPYYTIVALLLFGMLRLYRKPVGVCKH